MLFDILCYSKNIIMIEMVLGFIKELIYNSDKRTGLIIFEEMKEKGLGDLLKLISLRIKKGYYTIEHCSYYTVLESTKQYDKKGDFPLKIDI
jgi:hypothetical protein